MATKTANTPTKFQFKKLQSLALPILSLRHRKTESEEDTLDATAYIRIDGPIRVGRTKDNGEKSADMAPITVLAEYVDDHGTKFPANARAMTSVAAVFKSRLEDNFPGEGYVNKSFAIVGTGKIPGSRAKGYTIDQIEVD